MKKKVLIASALLYGALAFGAESEVSKSTNAVNYSITRELNTELKRQYPDQSSWNLTFSTEKKLNFALSVDSSQIAVFTYDNGLPNRDFVGTHDGRVRRVTTYSRNESLFLSQEVQNPNDFQKDYENTLIGVLNKIKTLNSQGTNP